MAIILDMHIAVRLALLPCLMAVGLWLTAAQRASACSCLGVTGPEAEFERQGAVFRGTVVDVTDQDRGQLGTPEYAGPSRFVTFDVEASWKGITTTVVTLRTGFSGGDCGYAFEVGQTYLVYAYPVVDSEGRPVREWASGLCSRNAPVGEAAEDLAFLESQPALTLVPVEPPDGQSADWSPLFIAIGALVGLSVIVYLASRRLRAGS